MSTSQPPQSAEQVLAALQKAVYQQAEYLIVSRQRVAALEARAALEDRGLKARMPIEFRSQYGEDLWIWDVLGRQTEGFFIEVGAFDGYRYSVTYAFEAMGWNGLLIEAIPERFEQCKARRVHSRVEHAAMGRRGETGSVEFMCVDDQYGGMLSYKAAPTEHARKMSANPHLQRSVRVPVTTMDELLKDYTGPIDAAVIDVEDGEMDLLDGFDLKRFRPRVMLIEDNYRGQNSAVGTYMASQDYVFAGWLQVNRLYVRKDEKHLLEHFKRA